MRLALVLLTLCQFIAAPVLAARCDTKDLNLQVLGSGGPELDDGRNSSAYLLWRKRKAIILVDAGSGAARAYEDAGARFEDLRAILISHFHVDHSQDLPALIKGSFFTQRDVDLPLFGPDGNALMPSTAAYAKRLLGEQGAYAYLAEYVERERAADFHLLPEAISLKPGTQFQRQLDGDIRISAIPVHHGPVAALAWRVDVGSCSVLFSGDTSNRNRGVDKLAAGADLFVAHNAIPEGTGGIARNLHMPPSEIGRIAASAGVGQILLSHFMNRSLGREQESLAAIRRHFQGPVIYAEDGGYYSPALMSGD